MNQGSDASQNYYSHMCEHSEYQIPDALSLVEYFAKMYEDLRIDYVHRIRYALTVPQGFRTIWMGFLLQVVKDNAFQKEIWTARLSMRWGGDYSVVKHFWPSHSWSMLRREGM